MEIGKVMAHTILNEQALIDEYAAECSIDVLGPVRPQWAMYERLESAGAFQAFAAFDGKIVGFATLVVSVLPHYGAKVGLVESLYVAQDHRTTPASAMLMSTIEDHAASLDCSAVLYSAPRGGRLDALLTKRKYELTNHVYCRALIPHA